MKGVVWLLWIAVVTGGLGGIAWWQHNLKLANTLFIVAAWTGMVGIGAWAVLKKPYR